MMSDSYEEAVRRLALLDAKRGNGRVAWDTVKTGAVVVGGAAFILSIFVSRNSPSLDDRMVGSFLMASVLGLMVYAFGVIRGQEAAGERSEVAQRASSSPEEKLLFAVRERDLLRVQMLLHIGVNPKARDKAGRTALMYAVRYESGKRTDLRIARLILHLVPDLLDAQDTEGWTALMHAAESGEFHGMLYLLHRGARKDVRNLSGQTAEMLPRWVGYFTNENKQWTRHLLAEAIANAESS